MPAFHVVATSTVDDDDNDLAADVKKMPYNAPDEPPISFWHNFDNWYRLVAGYRRLIFGNSFKITEIKIFIIFARNTRHEF